VILRKPNVEGHIITATSSWREYIAHAECSCGWQSERWAGTPAGQPGLFEHRGFEEVAAMAHYTTILHERESRV
jgi:hypothetical protein